MDLQQLRSQIDEIDDALVSLFVKRMGIAAAIGNYKKQQGLPILMPQREQEKLMDIALKAGSDLAPYARRLYEEIFTLSREYQAQGRDEVG